MDWIEKFFGISPDGGSGMTELGFLLVVLVILALVTLTVWRRVQVRVRDR